MPDRSLLDPYEVLGVPRDASLRQVDRAHRRLAKRHHPDLNPDADAERMRRINEAWQVLSTPARRDSYDRGHPVADGPNPRHWAGSRRPIRPAAPSTTRTWASWRVTAAETWAAPRTTRQRVEPRVPPTRRPARMVAHAPTFRDSGWAAIAAVALILGLLATTIALGRLV